MKADLFTIDGKKSRTVDLPIQCVEEYRPDMIHRAFLAYQSRNRQPYGAFHKAGTRSSAKLSRRRRQYKTSYGHGISRVPRKSLWKRGRQFGWVGAFAPGMVGGRKAHPPKPHKIFAQKINKKERRKAIRSAIAATVNPELVKQRGHKTPVEYPFIIDGAIEHIAKTKEIKKLLLSLGFEMELERSAQKKIRAGKGKRRGRRYQKRKGILIVVSQECPLREAARGLPGTDVIPAKGLNAHLLAPGARPGRITLWTTKALEIMETERLFT